MSFCFLKKYANVVFFTFSNNTKFLISQNRNIKGLYSRKETINRRSVSLQSCATPKLWKDKNSSTVGIFLKYSISQFTVLWAPGFYFVTLCTNF